MLEKACTTVESAAKGGGVYPEVLFDVAKQWFSLYQKVGWWNHSETEVTAEVINTLWRLCFSALTPRGCRPVQRGLWPSR